MNEATKNLVRLVFPRSVLRPGARTLERLQRWRTEWPVVRLVLSPLGRLNIKERRMLARRILAAHSGIECSHTHDEMVQIVRAIFERDSAPHGAVIVEAGCFKGGSTAKLSLAARAVGRRLVVFDSFEGLPESSEAHDKTIFGDQTCFAAGVYAGALEEVRGNVTQFGDVESCEFVRGWFSDTMPTLTAPVMVGFVDVDLAASTRTCLEYVYPLLVPGGVLFSHDGHLPLCIDVMRDSSMWAAIGGPSPIISGLGSKKLVTIMKPRVSETSESV